MDERRSRRPLPEERYERGRLANADIQQAPAWTQGIEFPSDGARERVEGPGAVGTRGIRDVGAGLEVVRDSNRVFRIVAKAFDRTDVLEYVVSAFPDVGCTPRRRKDPAPHSRFLTHREDLPWTDPSASKGLIDGVRRTTGLANATSTRPQAAPCAAGSLAKE